MGGGVPFAESMTAVLCMFLFVGSIQPSQQSLNVEKLYGERCAACHGDELQGASASSLRDGVWRIRENDATIARRITDGHAGDRAGKVPALGDASVRALVIYIREWEARERASSIPWRPPTLSRLEISSEREQFALETVVVGLVAPWGLAFLPDGRMLVTERKGQLRVVEHGALLPEPIAGVPLVWAKGQGGLLDVAVDPKYAENGWVYLSFSDDGGGDRATTAVARGRLVSGRWTDQQVLLRPPVESYRQSMVHFGSRMAFDNEGQLFVSIGDRAFPMTHRICGRRMARFIGSLRVANNSGMSPSVRVHC